MQVYSTSQKYKDYIAAPNREFEVQAIIDEVIYGSDEVVEFTVEDMLTGGDELTLGTVIPAKMSIKIKTTDTISTNAKIVPALRLNGPDGYTEWIPMGEFYIDSRQYQNGIWTFSCVDKLITTEQPYVSSLTYPVAMSEVFEEILDILDIESDAVINSAFQIPYKDESISIRDMLSCIASAHGANVKMNREGELIFVPLSPSLPVATITASNYIRAEQTNPEKSYAKLEVVHNAEGETLSRGTGSEDNTLKFENRFMFIEQNQLNYAFSVMNGFSYVPYSMTWTGRPDLDVGDAIKIVLQDATEITSILAVNKISFKGGLLQQSSAPSKSEQQSEFQFQGSISKQIAQRLVKDHTYNGVSFGPQYGVRVEDSAKYMRLEMNALDGYKMYLSDDAGNSWEAVFYIIVEDGKPRLYLGGNAEFQGLVKASEFLGGKIEIVKMVGLSGTLLTKQKVSGVKGETHLKTRGKMLFGCRTEVLITGYNGGIIRTAASGARIEISNNQIKTYNSAEQLQGFATNNEGQQYGDAHVYDGDVVVFEIYNNFFGNGVSLRPANGAGLSIGANGHNTRFYGNVADYIWHGTQAEAEAKTDWIDGQYADIEGSKASIGDVINFSLPENVDGSTLTFQECGNRFNEIGYLCNLLTSRLNVIINYLTETTEEMEVDPNL